MSEIPGLVLGFGIGGACCWFDIPVPAPRLVVANPRPKLSEKRRRQPSARR